jgi:energy-coupling factor transport system substrate-specific component
VTASHGQPPVGLDRFGSLAIAIASVLGAVAFLWPLFIPAHGALNQAHAGDAPWVIAALLPLLLVAVLGEFSSGGMDAKGVAMLGVLGACGAALRLPSGGAAGFEPVFFLLFPAGYVFGRHFGFLLGALTLFASALVTGGVGPWLPFQMMAAAWMGYGAGCLPHLRGRRELVVLAAYAAFACLAYGLLLDLWFWPFGAGTASTLSFEPGASVAHNLVRFLLFHSATSLGFDLPRAALNAGLILVAGRPVLAALRRASHRAAFGAPVEIVPHALETPTSS